MVWTEFIGNRAAVEHLQHLAAAAGRERHAQRTLVLAGPDGVGKTTLAALFGLALNCQAPPEPGGICGSCASCRQAAAVASLPELIAAAQTYRTAEVKTSARQQAPLRVALHPAIHLFPPDGDFLTMAQARAIIHQDEMQPDAGQSWTLIVPDFDRARWATQAALLKTLEEPSPGTVILLLARNPGALLPTVRSRALELRLAPVPQAELAAALVTRGQSPASAELLARLAQGGPGRALTLDLTGYQQTRSEALELLRLGVASDSLATVFRLSESVRASKEKFESLLEILYSVLQDIVYLQAEFPNRVGNVGCLPELRSLAQRLAPARVREVVEGLDRIQAAAQRNSFRPLALASWTLGLAAAGT